MAQLGMPLRFLPNVRGVFYGWWLVGIGAVVMILGTGPLFSGMPVWNVVLRKTFGWNAGQLSLAWSFQRAEGSVMGPIGGYLVDRLGPRWMALIGLWIMGGGFLLFSQVQSLWMFYLSFVIMGMGGGIGTWLPMMTALNHWFHRRRSLAMGISMEGFYIGGVVVPPLLGWTIDPDAHGLDRWKEVAAIIGVFTIIAAVPISRLIRNSPEEYGQRPDGDTEPSPLPVEQARPVAHTDEDPDFSMWEAVRTRSFWLISLGHAFGATVNVTVMIHLGLLLDDRQFDLTTVGFVSAIMMGVAAAFTLVGGWLSDRLPIRYSLFGFAAFQSLSIVVLTVFNAVWAAFLFAVLMGIGWGGRTSPTSSVRGVYFGRKAFASITGMSMVPMNVVLLIAPLLAGFGYDATGSFYWPFLTVAAVSFTGSCFYLMLGEPQTKAAALQPRSESGAVSP